MYDKYLVQKIDLAAIEKIQNCKCHLIKVLSTEDSMNINEYSSSLFVTNKISFKI